MTSLALTTSPTGKARSIVQYYVAATHEPIDILNGRDGNTLREWLKRNRQSKIVTCDRAGVYAKAISYVLPESMQIADHFHLHQNLQRAVKEALKHELPNNNRHPK